MGQIQLSSIKQMAITFERHNSRNQSSQSPTSISSKSQAGFLQLQLQCNYKTDSRGKPSRNLSNSRKAMIILMKTLGKNGFEAINEQLKGIL
jgi:hypothetical protein